MRNSVRAFLYYLKKDSIFKYMTIIIISLSIVLALFIGNLDTFSFDTILYPLNAIKTFSVFLFFIFPIFFVFFQQRDLNLEQLKSLSVQEFLKKDIFQSNFCF